LITTQLLGSLTPASERRTILTLAPTEQLSTARRRVIMSFAAHRVLRLVLGVVSVLLWTTVAFAQTATVTRNVNLRSDASTSQPPIRLLSPSERPLTVLDPAQTSGYLHVRTANSEEGWVWARNVSVSATTPPPTPSPSGTPSPGPGVPGSATVTGCGDGLWKHVYNPQRLLVKQGCITVTGVIVDATATQSKHQPDGVWHEGDGDTHGWLKVDSQFANLLNAGNTSDEGGNLVFEIVCHFAVTQNDAKPSCVGFTDHTTIPTVGSHVAIRGTLVKEKNHGKWNESHPVTSITVQ
jgi:uncharacterized protein YraI